MYRLNTFQLVGLASTPRNSYLDRLFPYKEDECLLSGFDASSTRQAWNSLFRKNLMSCVSWCQIKIILDFAFLSLIIWKRFGNKICIQLCFLAYLGYDNYSFIRIVSWLKCWVLSSFRKRFTTNLRLDVLIKSYCPRYTIRIYVTRKLHLASRNLEIWPKQDYFLCSERLAWFRLCCVFICTVSRAANIYDTTTEGLHTSCKQAEWYWWMV